MHGDESNCKSEDWRRTKLETRKKRISRSHLCTFAPNRIEPIVNLRIVSFSPSRILARAFKIFVLMKYKIRAWRRHSFAVVFFLLFRRLLGCHCWLLRPVVLTTLALPYPLNGFYFYLPGGNLIEVWMNGNRTGEGNCEHSPQIGCERTLCERAQTRHYVRWNELPVWCAWKCECERVRKRRIHNST